MKRFLPAVLVIAAMLTTCKEKEYMPVESVELSSKEASILEGKTLQLKKTVNPSTATISRTDWVTTDESIADVDANGLVKAVMEGTATISVTVLGMDGSSASTTCIINVIGAVPNITALKMNVESYTLTVKQKLQLLVAITPENASSKDIVWTSSSEKIAKVSSTGLVTAVSAGNATIQASTADGRVKTTCAITVRN